MKNAWIRLVLLLAVQVGALLSAADLQDLDSQDLKDICHQLHSELLDRC